MAGVDVRFETRGPLFDGRFEAQVRAGLEDAKADVAREGVNLMLTSTRVFRNPTGYYKSQIQTSRVAETHLISDNDVPYGPWLEGVSQRNAAGRFKGYRIWRLTTQMLNRVAGGIADRAIRRRLGG